MPSPDGGQIAFRTERDGNSEIYIMHADGSNQIRFTDHLGWDKAPDWSPDGTRIAFESNRDGDLDIYTMDSIDTDGDGNGDDLINLTNNLGLDRRPARWPQEGRTAFRSEFKEGDWEVHGVQDSGSTVSVVNTIDSDRHPSWSADGSQIVFRSNRDDLVNFEDVGEIYTMNADGSNQIRLTNNRDKDQDPDWGPFVPSE